MKQITVLIAVTLVVSGVFASEVMAERIKFQDRGVQLGTVLDEDESTVTIRFPKHAILFIAGRLSRESSIEKPSAIQPVPAEMHAWLEKLDRLEKRVDRIEKERNRRHSSPDPGVFAIEGVATIQQLVLEEMGSVRGDIVWRGNPLADGRVTIEMEKYTGLSIDAVKKAVRKGDGTPTGGKLYFTTRTDADGGYTFHEVPPGFYRLFWMPDSKTGWVRRLQGGPDFEIVSGRMTVQNIPD